MGIFDMIGNIFSASTSASASIYDTKKNYEIAQQNIQFQQDQNQITRNREDNAVQRRVKDLKAAGLSPVLAAGSPAAANPMQAPKNEFHSNIGEKTMNVLAALQMKKNIDKTTAEEDRIKAEANFIKKKTNPTIHGLDLQNQLMELMNPLNIKGKKLANYNQELTNKLTKANINQKEFEITLQAIKKQQKLADLSKTEQEIAAKKLLLKLKELDRQAKQHDLNLYKEIGLPTNQTIPEKIKYGMIAVGLIENLGKNTPKFDMSWSNTENKDIESLKRNTKTSLEHYGWNINLDTLH